MVEVLEHEEAAYRISADHRHEDRRFREGTGQDRRLTVLFRLSLEVAVDQERGFRLVDMLTQAK